MTTRTIKIEASYQPGRRCDTAALVERARELEDLGYDRLFIAEASHDPFLPLMLAAHHTSRIELGTGIAVAFGRNPMNIASLGHDLNAYADGRFRLGLGTQIKPHITRRFDMPWHGAAKQMREFIEAVRAIWDCWYDGVPLQYEGDIYRYTLMTPEFVPETDGCTRPKILLAAVGPRMLETAAAVADGLILHPFLTERYFREAVIPRIEPILHARGSSLDEFEIQYPALIATGTTDAEIEEAKVGVRYRMGFYGSTPAYKPVLDIHGWGELQPVLRNLTKAGRWSELGDHIDDEMLETFAAIGPPAEAATIVRQRYGDHIDSVVLGMTGSSQILAEQMDVLRGVRPRRV